MQSPTSNIVDQAINNLEAEEARIVVDDDKNPKGGQDDKPKDDPKAPAKDDGASKSKSKDDDGKPGNEEPAKPKYDKDGNRIEEEPKKPDDDKKEDEEGFTADDAVEEEEPTPPKANEEAPKDAAGVVLSPQEQKYIADNIGEPIVIRGIQGEGDNAKEVEIKAYSPQDIPGNFKFANDQQLLAAQEGFRRLETRAQDLLGRYRQDQSQAQAADFEKRENQSIRDDIADLQKDGRFPKFSVRPGTNGFDDSPEAKIVTDVLEIMQERNQMYLKQYEQGRAYKHIGFAEAYEIYEARNPERQAAKKADEDQKREDDERKNHAEDSRSNRGMSPNGVIKPTVRSGTTTRDILARIDAEDF